MPRDILGAEKNAEDSLKRLPTRTLGNFLNSSKDQFFYALFCVTYSSTRKESFIPFDRRTITEIGRLRQYQISATDRWNESRGSPGNQLNPA